MKVEMFVRIAVDSADESNSPRRRTYANACAIPDEISDQTLATNSLLHLAPGAAAYRLSPWASSAARRFFDCACVLVALPLLTPVLLTVALAVWLTSKGPILFRQRRVGAYGRLFTIFKFRTIEHDDNAAYHAITTGGNQPFTAIGPFLRRWKLDELPQIVNVLRGDMSLVGPRPKMPEHAVFDVSCRPGITGAATIAFAHEEILLDRVPEHDLENYYHKVVLPTKRRLDAEYMARASFLSDLSLIFNSVLRRWDDTVAIRLLTLESLMTEGTMREFGGNETGPYWNDSLPIRVASVSARIGAGGSA